MGADKPLGSVNGPPDAAVSLDPDLAAAAAARRFVHDNPDHLHPDVVADAELLVSEVVTNAVRHGAGEVALRLHFAPPSLVVAVTDAGERMPVVSTTPPGADRSSGRGLFIVDAVADAWGVTPHDPPPGKTVWFAVRPTG